MGTNQLVLIAGAGAAGAVARYLVSRSVAIWTGGSFPWGTFAVNVIGCLVFGVIWGLAEDRGWLGERARLAVLVGFLGAFTTFSSFAYENVALLREHQWWHAGLNVIGQNVCGIAAMIAGIALSRPGWWTS